VSSSIRFVPWLAREPSRAEVPSPHARHAVVVAGEYGQRASWPAAVKRCWSAGKEAHVTLVMSQDEARTQVAVELDRIRGIDVVEEPSERGTAVALATALLQLDERHLDSHVLVTCADSRSAVPDGAALEETIDHAFRMIDRDDQKIVLVIGFGRAIADGWMAVASYRTLLRLVEDATGDLVSRLRQAIAGHDVPWLALGRVYQSLKGRIDFRRQILPLAERVGVLTIAPSEEEAARRVGGPLTRRSA
jgi:hypothetical protein